MRATAYSGGVARSGRGRRGSRTQPVLITSAPVTADQDLSSRQTKYLALMSLRVICFVAAIFLQGMWRWVAVAGAAFLPAIAVVIANAIDLRVKKGGTVPGVTPQGFEGQALVGPHRPDLPIIIRAEPEPEDPRSYPADPEDPDGPDAPDGAARGHP